MKKNKGTAHQFLQEPDLTETQIYTTLQTYDQFARIYAEKWEWNLLTIREVKKYNIAPFVKYAKKGGTVLLTGCRSGRDYFLLSERGFRCLGIDPSYGLITEAVKRVPSGLFLQHELSSLPFIPESFDAVYADALTNIPKSEMKRSLRDFTIFLRRNGILYLSLKLSSSNVLQTNDLGGTRYFTLFRKKEIIEIVNSIGLDILWSVESPHTDPSLPNWFSLIAKKG